MLYLCAGADKAVVSLGSMSDTCGTVRILLLVLHKCQACTRVHWCTRFFFTRIVQ